MSSDLIEAAENCSSHLKGFRTLARVLAAERALDLALAHPQFGTLLIRYVQQVSPVDYRALTEMLTEGPFSRAILVCCEPDQTHLSDEIETWFIGDVERLAAELAQEAAA